MQLDILLLVLLTVQVCKVIIDIIFKIKLWLFQSSRGDEEIKNSLKSIYKLTSRMKSCNKNVSTTTVSQELETGNYHNTTSNDAYCPPIACNSLVSYN